MQQIDQSDTSVLTALFAHNAWANLKLLDFCEGLNDEQLDSTGVGCYGSIRDTLVHITGAEVSYVNQVNDRLPAVPIPRGQFLGFAVMKDAVRWTHNELLALATSARAETIIRLRPPRRIYEYRLANLMVQVINHATEHRTQISAIITQMGLEPPDMTGWAYMEEIGELKDFGETAEGS